MVAGNLDALKAVRDYVQTAAHQAGLSERAAYRLKLAVDELVDNIITYGYLENGIKGQLIISAEFPAGALVLTVEDNAPAYNPLSRPAPDLTLPYEQRPLGKLGIYLAKLGSDSLSYESGGDYNRTIFRIMRGHETSE